MVSDPVLATRDLVRQLAHVVVEIDGDDLEADLARADELALEARYAGRRARAELLLAEAPATALPALELLDSVERCLLAARGLRDGIRRYMLH